MQPRSNSRIADSLASRLEQLVQHLSREHLTVGIILLVLGVFAFQISPWLAWFTIGSGLLLLTWHARIRNTYRGLLYFIALLPVLHWFNSINEFLFHEDAVTGMMLSRDTASPLELVYGLIFAGVAIGGLIFVIRHRPYVRAIQAATGGTGNRPNKQARWSNVPARTFADVGGMDDQKSRISAVVRNRLYPERFKQHGVIQNGILLFGPRGTGKTFLAEATAGEFKINYWYAKPTSLIESRIGNSEANIRETFSRAYPHQYIAWSGLMCLMVSGLLRGLETFASQSAWNNPDTIWITLRGLVNWSCNVFLPVYAVLQIVQGVLSYGGVGHRIYHGSPWIRHFAAAGMALSLSGLLRLAEFFVRKGTAGIS